MLVLNGAVDVRLALEGLSDAAYDLILRPAASEVTSGRMTGGDRRASEIRLLPSGLPPLTRGERATITALHDLIAARDAGTGAHSERVRLYALAVAHAHGMDEAVDVARAVRGVREVKTQQVEVPPIPPFVA